MGSMDEFFKAKKTGQSANEASKSDKARPEGDVEIKRYRNYYDIADTITTAQATDPNDQDSVNYDQEQVFVSLERNAEKIIVSNDGLDTLFVIASHEGGQNFSRERPIYPGENKIYFNIYELRLRSPTAGLAYRVTEYPICCTSIQLPANRAFTKTEEAQDSVIVAAVAAQKFRLMYIQITVTNNDGAAGGFVRLSGTINGVVTNIAVVRVPIGAQNFSSTMATDCDILFDTNTTLDVNFTGTIFFNVQIAGRYE